VSNNGQLNDGKSAKG